MSGRAREVRERLRAGVVIPAHPLALTPTRSLDERRQRALTRYYMAAGAGGVAVGVHTTQFAIRDPQHALLAPVLELARDEVRHHEARGDTTTRPVALIAGVCGRTAQALREAALARDLGYDAGLLSLGALADATDDELVAHCRSVAEVIPLFGFYLQPAVGGRVLGYRFWRRFAEIDNVWAIKVAPFNRYWTLDVVRALADAGRDDVALYTGNDDSIVSDLVTPMPLVRPGEGVVTPRGFDGGLLGQWAVWTQSAVSSLSAARRRVPAA